MSSELKSFLNSRGIATSRTSSYNPQGNGQCERFNGIIWSALTLALRDRNLPPKYWQVVLPDVLHSARSLLCTATNSTPHERFLGFQRRSSTGSSIPFWLTTGDTALLKKHVRLNKSDPLVEEVTLIHVNPQYAHVKHSNGRESTVSIKHLAPPGNETAAESSENETATLEPGEVMGGDTLIEDCPKTADDSMAENSVPEYSQDDMQRNDEVTPPTRSPSVVSQDKSKLIRSIRIRRAPDRLQL